MAKLPSEADLLGRERMVTVSGAPNAARKPYPVSTGQSAEGMADLAKAFGGVAQEAAIVHLRKQEHENDVRVEDAFNKLREQQLDLTYGQENGFTQKKAGDAVNEPILKNWSQKFSDKAKGIEESLATPEQKERFRLRANIAKAGFEGDIMKHVAHQSDVYQDGVFKATLDTEARSVGASPADEPQFLFSLERVNNAVNREGQRLGKTNAEIDVSKAKAVDHLWLSRLEALRVADPVAALQTFQEHSAEIGPDLRRKLAESLFRDAAPVLASTLKQQPLQAFAANEPEAQAIVERAARAGLRASVTVDKDKAGTGGVFGRLPTDQKLLVLDMAHTQMSQDLAQVRQNLSDRVRDATASLERGLSTSDVPARDELRVAFGAERGERIARDLEQARAFGDDYIRIAAMPRSEQQTLLGERQPQPGTGFAEAQHRQEQLASAIERVRSSQDQDPAAYVLQESPVRQRVLRSDGPPEVKVAYQAMIDAQSDPNVSPEAKAAAAQKYAAATIAEQQRLEIPNPKVLPKVMVDSIAKRFAEPPAQGESMGNVMRGMVDQWGPYWPRVATQLKGRIPPEATVIALGVTGEAEAILSEAAKLKPEQLNQGVPEPDRKDLKERVRTALEPLQRTLAWQGGGIETYDNYADSAEKVAVSLMQKGMKPKDAAGKAVESLVGFKYEFEDTWRAPKSALTGGTTLSLLRSGADAIKRDVGSDKPVLGEKVGLLVPETPAGMRPKDAERMWRDTIASNGFWVTTPGDGGLSLYVKSGLAAVPVLDDKGAPVRKSWDEISGIGRAARAAYFSDVKRRP